MGNTIKIISDQLARIFRHIIPGILIVGAARIAHPDWFSNLSVDSWPPLLMLAAIAIAVGNVWYVFHRYALHQLIDWVLFFLRPGSSSYSNFLQQSIENHFKADNEETELRDHIRLWSSQIILMLISAEVLLLFSLWNNESKILDKHGEAFVLVSVVMFVFGFWQYYLCNTIDRETASNFGRKNNNAHKDNS
jgi:hypothetical protein